MPCAGPAYNCNSLVNIRTPLGVVRLGAPDSAAPNPSSIRLLIRAYLAVRETLAHRRQHRALAVLDWRLLRDIGCSREQADHEIHKPFWK